MAVMDVSTYEYEEFHERYGQLDLSALPGVRYRQNRLMLVPIVAYSVLFVVGIGGNIWVAIVVGCVIGKSRTPAVRCVQVYILALCCCDLVVLLFSSTVIVDLIYGQWLVQSTFLCRLYLSSECLSKFCTPFLLVALSYFCYAKICRQPFSNAGRILGHPLSGDTAVATAVALGCTALAYVLLAPVYVYGNLHYIVYENDTRVFHVETKCAFQTQDETTMLIFLIYGFVLGYVVPTALFTSFHATILLRVRRQASGGVGIRRAQKYIFRVANTILGLVVFYWATTSPYWILNLFNALKPMDDGRPEMDTTSVVLNYLLHILPYLNCTGYPIVYTLLNRDIRDAYKRTRNSSGVRTPSTDFNLRLLPTDKDYTFYGPG